MASQSSGYILVVEDVQFMRRQLMKMIATIGYDALDAADGAQAIRTMQLDPPALLLLDLQLPKVTGFQVCEWVRKNDATKKMPVVICTASHDRKTLEKAIKAGATDVLVKPVTKEHLRERIEKHLGASA